MIEAKGMSSQELILSPFLACSHSCSPSLASLSPPHLPLCLCFISHLIACPNAPFSLPSPLLSRSHSRPLLFSLAAPHLPLHPTFALRITLTVSHTHCSTPSLSPNTPAPPPNTPTPWLDYFIT